MLVKIKFFGLPVGFAENEFSADVADSATIGDLIEAISANDVKKTELLRNSVFLVNKSKSGLKTVLHDNDEVFIMRVLGGG